jgi:hypothetical protein
VSFARGRKTESVRSPQAAATKNPKNQIIAKLESNDISWACDDRFLAKNMQHNHSRGIEETNHADEWVITHTCAT